MFPVRYELLYELQATKDLSTYRAALRERLNSPIFATKFRHENSATFSTLYGVICIPIAT